MQIVEIVVIHSLWYNQRWWA